MAPHLRPVKLRDKLLSSRHIRLVGLHPPGHPDDSQRYSLRPQARRLRCEVYQASLDDISSDGEPNFAALSYVCGSPTLTQHVWCAQDYVPTTQNLFEALLHIRYEDRPRLLWADGLCIDQKNTEERNHQVGMLHEIYSQAHVITWLGSGDQTDSTALADYIFSTSRVYTHFLRSRKFAGRTLGDIVPAATAYCEELFAKSTIPNTSQILNAPYFTRVWVAQEVFLAKSGICQLGPQLFSVATLAASMQLWGHQKTVTTDLYAEELSDEYLAPSLRGTWVPSWDPIQMQDLYSSDESSVSTPETTFTVLQHSSKAQPRIQSIIRYLLQKSSVISRCISS